MDGSITVIGRLERAAAAFAVFRRVAGLKDVRFPQARLNGRGGDDPLVNLFSPSAWDAFCDHYRQDYTCLGYEPPRACRDRWRR